MATTTQIPASEAYAAEARKTQILVDRRLTEWTDAMVEFGTTDRRTLWAKDLLDHARKHRDYYLNQAVAAAKKEAAA